MRVIPVEFVPFKTYDSAAEAINAAERHPLQAKARADTAKLSGTTIVDAYWTDVDHVIRFSNGQLLHIFLNGEKVAWAVTDQPPQLDEKEVECIGAPPLTLRWPKSGHGLMDRNALATARIGCEFQYLYASEGLWVYCRGVWIWWFTVIRDTERNRRMLYVSEDD